MELQIDDIPTFGRAGEGGHPPFRSDRFCQVNGMWYFLTREKTQEGPFVYRFAAKLGLQRYLERVRGG